MTRIDEEKPGQLDLQISPGIRERMVVIETTGAPARSGGTAFSAAGARPVHYDVAGAIGRFSAAVETGMLEGPEEGQGVRVLSSGTRREGELEHRTWELSLPRLAPSAFLPLLRMTWLSGTVRSVRIVENIEAAERTVRAIAQLGNLPRFDPPWEVDQNLSIHRGYAVNAKDSVVMVVLNDDAPPDLATTVHALLGGWGELVCAGAFEGAEHLPGSGGVVGELGSEAANELFIGFDFLTCGRDGWDSLMRALERIHRTAPMVRVELGT